MKARFLSFLYVCLAITGCETDKPVDKPDDKQVPVKLETPAGLKTDKRLATASSLFVMWDAPESGGIESYTVACALKESENYSETECFSTGAEITGLEDMKDYKIRVKANSPEGAEYDSDWSETVFATTGDVFLMTVPANFGTVAGETTKTSFKVKWDEVPNADGYRVACKSVNGEEDFTQTDVTETFFSLTGLEAGSGYILKVKAVSPSGEDFDSEYTDELTVTTLTRTSGISDAAELLEFAAEVNGGATDGGTWKNAFGEVVIMEDIDLQGMEWTPLAKFTGVLNGNGKTISNLVYSSGGTAVGMIVQLSGTLKNLTLGPNCSFTSTAASGTVANGAFVATLLEGGTVDNCVNRAAVTGGTSVGGIAGEAVTNQQATISNCDNYGAVRFPETSSYGTTKIGGILGHGESNNTVIYCNNYGPVSTAATAGAHIHAVGGIAGLISGSSVTFCSNRAEGSVNLDALSYANAYIGGVAGRSYYPYFADCTNDGAVRMVKATAGNRDLRVGGIVGILQGSNTYPIAVERCVNNADITITATGTVTAAYNYAGGIVGQATGVRGLYIDDCTNRGDIDLSIVTRGSAVAGIIGNMAPATGAEVAGVMRESRVYNCKNEGDISAECEQNDVWVHAGGVAGACNNFTTVEKCTNSGMITSKTINRISAGGVIGETNGPVKDCSNAGTIIAERQTGNDGTPAGVVSRVQASTTVSGCVNTGTVVHGGGNTAGANASGGVVGRMHSGTIEACENYGTIVDYDMANVSAICGLSATNGALTIRNCKVGGAVGLYDPEAADKGAGAATALTQGNFADYIYAKTTNATTLTDNTFGIR